MGVIVEDIRYLDKFRPAETDVDWALYTIGELADIEIDFRVEEVAIATSKSFEDSGWIQASAQPRETGLALTSGVIWTDIANAFENFYVGDTVTITGTGSNDGTYTIIYKESNEIIQVGSSLQFKFFPEGAAIYVSTPFRGLRYYYNFLANNAATNFESLTTGETQLLVYDDIDNTDVTAYSMIFKGLKDYQIGSATIEGNGSSTYGQKFTLKQTTILNPLYLEAQYDDLIARIKPTYFESDNCLKHIFRLEVNRDLTNPNDTVSIDYDERLGNTGWYNENYNGGDTNYSFSNVVITRVSDSEVLNELELNSSCDIDFRVTNTVDSPFSAGNTKGMAIFYQLPEEENYINNGRSYADNFVYDRIIQTEGAAAVSGSTGYAINEFTITYVDADNIDVRIRIDISANGQNYINENDFKRYLVSFVVENHALTRETSDKVNLLINTNDFGLSLTKSDLITNSTKFMFHRFSDFADGLTTPDVFPVDDMVAYSEFSIDFNGLTADNIDILSVSNELVLTHATNADIILESNTYNTGGSTLLDGYVPLIDLEQNRAYTIADNDFRKLVEIKRNEANDSGTVFAYKCIYPFFIRWETWEALSGVSNPPAGVYDSSLPNNGINHFWYRYSTLGYTLKYRLRFTITQNGEQFTQEFDSALTMYDFNSNSDWTNESIKSYDVTSSTELISGSDKFLQGYVDTRLEAAFDKTTGSLPNLNNVDIVFWIIGKEKGTFKSVRRASSFYSDSGDTWFKGITTGEQVDKTKVGSVYTGKVLVDFTKLSGSEFTVYSRLHDNLILECIIIKNNNNSVSTFDPAITTTGSTGTFVLGDGSPDQVANSISYNYADNNTYTAKYCLADLSDVTTIDLRSDNIVDTLDLTKLDACANFLMRFNSGLTGITFPTATVNISNVEFHTCGITGVVDLSPLGSFFGGDIQGYSNASMTGLTLPTSSRTITGFLFNNCGLTGTLDLSMLTGLGGIVYLYSCSSLTGITFPTTTQFIDALLIRFNNLTGSVDLTGLQNLRTTLDAQSNPLMTSISLPSNSNTFTLISINSCGLTGYVDFTVIPNATDVNNSDINLRVNAITAAADINHILVDLDTNSVTGSPAYTSRKIQLDGGTNAAPDTTSGGYNGSAAVTSLTSKGFTVTTN